MISRIFLFLRSIKAEMTAALCFKNSALLQRLSLQYFKTINLRCYSSVFFCKFKEQKSSKCVLHKKQTMHTSTIFFDNESKDIQKHTEEKPQNNSKLKQTGKLAKVFAKYGTTAIVFHTTISLTSLGISYMAVSSGIDVVNFLQKFNLITEATMQANVASGATTFVIAYACHKVFMPVRIFITVSCTPLIVKKLKGIGLLKSPTKR